MNMQITHITDLDIQAFIDNELDWESEKHIRERIEHDSYFLKRYNELLKQKKLIQEWFKSN